MMMILGMVFGLSSLATLAVVCRWIGMICLLDDGGEEGKVTEGVIL